MDFLINFKDVSFKYKGKEEPSIKNINLKLAEYGYIGGFDLGEVSDDFKNHMLVAVTELRSKDEIDDFVTKAGELND